MWDKNRNDYSQRLASIQSYLTNKKFVDAKNLVALLSNVIRSGDLVCIEGDNQKQATYTSRGHNLKFFASHLRAILSCLKHLHMNNYARILNMPT